MYLCCNTLYTCSRNNRYKLQRCLYSSTVCALEDNCLSNHGRYLDSSARLSYNDIVNSPYATSSRIYRPSKAIRHDILLRKAPVSRRTIASLNDVNQISPLYQFLKRLVDEGGHVDLSLLQKVYPVAIEALKDDSEFALKCIFLVLIAYTGDVPVDVVNQMSKVIDTVRSTTKPALQLEMINIFCAMRNYHPQMHSQLEHRHRAYMEYLDEMGHYIRLSVPHEIDPTQIDSLRATLDSLNVKHYAGISGHIYMPIVIQDSQLAIEFVTQSDLQSMSMEARHPIKLKMLLLEQMGWRVTLVKEKQWNALDTDDTREKYISKLLAYMYMDAQFMYKPAWVKPYVP